MSYCRFSSGKVYLYADIRGYICCCGCFLEEGSVQLNSYDAALNHIEKHKETGHEFPYEKVRDRLIQERESEQYNFFEEVDDD